VAAGQIDLVAVQAEVDTVPGVAAGRTVLEVVAGHTGPVVAVVGTVQERHNLAVVEERHIGPEAELHTGPEVDRHTGSAAAHHIDLAEVAGRSLAEAGSHRTVDFALVAVDGNLVVEVVDIVAAGRILEGAGLL
jgi:hypothetical protein